VTDQEIIQKSICPTCGAGKGQCCSQGAGRLRSEPHFERKTTARGGTIGNFMAMVRHQMASKNSK